MAPSRMALATPTVTIRRAAPGAVRRVQLEQSDAISVETIVDEVRQQQASALDKGWQLLRVELVTNPYQVVNEVFPDGRLRVDDVEADVVAGSGQNGIHVIAVDAHGVAHRL